MNSKYISRKTRSDIISKSVKDQLKRCVRMICVIWNLYFSAEKYKVVKHTRIKVLCSLTIENAVSVKQMLLAKNA